jgi:cyclic dehypoxanthinyl futalosine synthase
MIATNNSLNLDRLLSKAADGRRLSVDDALHLAADASLTDLGLAADARRNQLHPGRRVSYIVERNINYTNVCNVYCRFCAFYRAPGRPGGYTLSKEELAAKIDETVAAGGIQILLQGGLNPDCGIEYYEDLFQWLKRQYPTVNLHALSADEVLHVCKVSNLSIEESLSRLIAAGMGSLPGAGAEILVDHVRKRIARLKSGADKWLAVHRAAHRLGIPSTCTMMFGVKETWRDRILHLEMLRQLQDETGGFTAFITWPYQQGDMKLAAGNTSAAEYLRVQALARLFLDNIPHLQSSWVTQGPSIGQIALSFGADDFGAVMFEENVVSAAGTTFRMNSDFIESQIRRAGFTPWRRNVRYQAA